MGSTIGIPRAGLSPGQPPSNFKTLRSLVNRVTNGFSQEEWQRAQALGHVGYVEYHLDHLSIDDSATDALLAPLDTLPMTSAQMIDAGYTGAHVATPMFQLKQSALIRGITSRRQLFERTVAFFTDHLSIFHKDGGVRMHKLTDDRTVIRAHAFGSFHDMLRASAQSAAMLQYLDNNTNTLSGPQENYARELMELHTLGVGGGYGEDDVKEAARCLTGWTFNSAWQTPTFGVFGFDAATHDDGQKVVLGQVFPPGQGMVDGDQLITMLLQHPSTGRFLGRKLLRWFGVYQPSEDLVTSVANVYVSTNGDIKSMLRVVLGPQAFQDMRPGKNPKLKRPEHFVAGLFRALGATLSPVADYELQPALVGELRVMGQSPFDWPTPDGYPDTLVAWGSGLQPRWSLASRLLDGTCTAASIDPSSILESLSSTQALGWGSALSQLLTGGGLSAADRAALDVHAAGMPIINWPQVAELIALAASCPSYQWS